MVTISNMVIDEYARYKRMTYLKTQLKRWERLIAFYKRYNKKNAPGLNLKYAEKQRNECIRKIALFRMFGE